MVSKQGVLEFKELVKSEYGIELSIEEATDQATNFLNLFKTLNRDQGNSSILLDPIDKKS